MMTPADAFLFEADDHIGTARDNLIAARSMVETCSMTNDAERSALWRAVDNALDEILDLHAGQGQAVNQRRAGQSPAAASAN
ncbi:MAG: hypothetical protein ACOH2N_11310 [Devosia sp.]